MRVLVVGGGGREHALSWALARSASVEHVVCAPGNAGTAEVAENRPLDVAAPDAVVRLAREVSADLVVVGPEAPLVAGVTDALGEAGIPAFGPSAAAAELEGSKAFAKSVMADAGVRTAGFWTGDDPAKAREALDGYDAPYVIKADGLAAGKGVRICADRDEAEQAIDEALVDRIFGDAGASLVIEEFMAGPECSLFGISDGTTVLAMTPAQDFKRALDGDEGLNTGGMGAYSPVPAVDESMVESLRATVLQPMVDEMARRGTPFRGLLYAGLVLTADGPKVIEFNVRFGDPETQVVLPRLRDDLGEVLLAAANGDLGERTTLAFSEEACVTVVLASGGYPGSYESGKPIDGLREAGGLPGVTVFHAGTAAAEGQVRTAGGRVLAVSALGVDIGAARDAAYEAVEHLSFAGVHHRRDIASRPTV